MNIAEILKDVPKRTKLYSPAFGKVEFIKIDTGYDNMYPIIVDTQKGIEHFTKDGRYFYLGEEMLFPSEDNRDWNTFTIPEIRKEKEIAPGTLVLVPYVTDSFAPRKFMLGVYSHWDSSCHQYVVNGRLYPDVLPYEGNEDKLGKEVDRLHGNE